MSRDLVNRICAAFPGAEVYDPWGGGHDAWKVGGKMFACVAARRPEVAVKTDSIETAEMLISTGVGHKAAYMHRSWISLPLDTRVDELEHRLTQAYRIIRAGLPRRVEEILDPMD